MTFINIFSFSLETIRLEVSGESSARQWIHMKNQALFSAKDKSKKVKCHLLQFRNLDCFGREATFHNEGNTVVTHRHRAKCCRLRRNVHI